MALPQFPGFPRRGIPTPKVRLPLEREPRKPLFQTASGRRLVLYGVVLAFAATAIAGGINTKSKSQNGQGADSRPESRVVPLTHRPRAYVPGEVMHQLISIDDNTRMSHSGAIGAAIQYLKSIGGPESRASIDWTPLDPVQALAYPEEFRGGLVKLKGNLLRDPKFWGRDVQQTGIPMGVVYESFILVGDGHKQDFIAFVTDELGPGLKENLLVEAEGVFLQTIQWEDKNHGTTNAAPLVAVRALRLAPPDEQPVRFLDKIFPFALPALIILVLVTTLFLLRLKKSSQLAPGRRFVARPPGPGR